MANYAEIVSQITEQHLNNNGVLLGQCLTAVGWVGGTIPKLPNHPNIIELPTSDSSNSGIVCGFALAGKRPVYVIRYQGFLWYNAVSLFNYAAKSMELWNTPCPVFIRAIGMEGGIGPVAGGMLHSLAMHIPGLTVCAPITPEEWSATWNYFIEHNVPVFCSEHRRSFSIPQGNFKFGVNTFNDHATLSVVCIGAARLNAAELLEQREDFNLIHLYKLKPLSINYLMNTINTKKVLIIDSDYTICGASEHIAYELIKRGLNCRIAGLKDQTAGFNKQYDVLTPSTEEIGKLIDEYV